MTKATFTKTNITVYIHEGVSSKLAGNAGMIVVSKQPNSMMTFCVNKEDLILA